VRCRADDACSPPRRSALHNAAEAGDLERLAQLLASKGAGDDDFDPVRARLRCAGARCGAARVPPRWLAL
jgi:hypothetical protein